MNYFLNIKVPFSAMDDIAAKESAKEILRQLTSKILPDRSQMKLQRLEDGKPPFGIQFPGLLQTTFTIDSEHSLEKYLNDQLPEKDQTT